MARPAVPASSKRPSQEGQREYDAGKRVKERKRHIASDATAEAFVKIACIRRTVRLLG